MGNQALRQQALKKVIADKSNQIPEDVEPILEKVLLIFSQHGLAGVQKSIASSSLKEEAKESLYYSFQKTISLTAQKLLEEIESQNISSATKKENQQFAHYAVNAISALSLYDAPVFLQLEEIEPVNMSGLQLTRTPGKNIVYIGALLLVLGIYLMFYIQPKRIWLLFQGETILFALSSGRHNVTLEQDFNRQIKNLLALSEIPSTIK